jgi:hypothetical protein
VFFQNTASLRRYATFSCHDYYKKSNNRATAKADENVSNTWALCASSVPGFLLNSGESAVLAAFVLTRKNNKILTAFG